MLYSKGLNTFNKHLLLNSLKSIQKAAPMLLTPIILIVNGVCFSTNEVTMYMNTLWAWLPGAVPDKQGGVVSASPWHSSHRQAQVPPDPQMCCYPMPRLYLSWTLFELWSQIVVITRGLLLPSGNNVWNRRSQGTSRRRVLQDVGTPVRG